MIPDPKREERLSPRQSHGVKALKHAVSTLGSRTLDRRTSVAKALAGWRSDLIADLGGLDAVSTQELALIEEAVKTKLILDSVDAWLLSQPSLVNKRARAVLPAVRDRNALVTTLRGLLTDLGLRRRIVEAPDLSRYLAQRYGGARGAPSEPTPTDDRPQGRPPSSPGDEGGDAEADPMFAESEVTA